MKEREQTVYELLVQRLSASNKSVSLEVPMSVESKVVMISKKILVVISKKIFLKKNVKQSPKIYTPPTLLHWEHIY